MKILKVHIFLLSCKGERVLIGGFLLSSISVFFSPPFFMTHPYFYSDCMDSTGCCITPSCPFLNRFLPLRIMSFHPERLFLSRSIHGFYEDLAELRRGDRGARPSPSLDYWVMFGSRLANK